MRTRLAVLLLPALLVSCQQLAPPTPKPAQPATDAAAPAPPRAARADLAASTQPAPVPPPPAPQPVASGLSVIGEATVRAEPDVAYLTTGVQTRGQTAHQAQEENTRRMNEVLAALKRLGVKEPDLRTTGFSLSPQYGRTPEQIEGYVAANSVTVTVQDVKRVGEVLDAAVSAGANQAGSIQFSIKDETSLRRQALDQAVKAARVRADAIAGAAGMRITSIQALTDVSSGAVPSPMLQKGVGAALSADQVGGPVPVQPGQLAVTARVQVIYTIQ